MNLRKVSAALIVGAATLFALPFASASNPEIITASEASSLGLQIPSSTPAGYQIVTIEVTDASGKVTTREIAFCKGKNGRIYWNNVCPTPQPVSKSSAVAAPTPSMTVATPTPSPTPTQVVHIEAKNHRNKVDGIGAGVALLLALFTMRLLPRRSRLSSRDIALIALAFEIDFLIFIGDFLIGNSPFLWAAAAISGVPRLRKLLKIKEEKA